MSQPVTGRPAGGRVSDLEVRVFACLLFLFAGVLGVLLLVRPAMVAGMALFLTLGWLGSLIGQPGHRRTPLWGFGLPALTGVLGAAALGGIDPRWLAAGLWSVGLLVAVLVLVSMEAGRAIRRVWMGSTEPMGWSISRLVLAITYFVVLTPIGLLLRVLRRDSMGIRFDRTAASYWIPRADETQLPRYFRQF